jgi:hypothetical protein
MLLRLPFPVLAKNNRRNAPPLAGSLNFGIMFSKIKFDILFILSSNSEHLKGLVKSLFLTSSQKGNIPMFNTFTAAVVQNFRNNRQNRADKLAPAGLICKNPATGVKIGLIGGGGQMPSRSLNSSSLLPLSGC